MSSNWRASGASGGPVLNVQNRPFWRAGEARGVIKSVPGFWGWPATWLVSQPRITPVRCPGLARRLPGQPGPASRAVCPVPASGASLPPPAARGLLAALAGPPGVARRAVVQPLSRAGATPVIRQLGRSGAARRGAGPPASGWPDRAVAGLPHQRRRPHLADEVGVQRGRRHAFRLGAPGDRRFRGRQAPAGRAA